MNDVKRAEQYNSSPAFIVPFWLLFLVIVFVVGVNGDDDDELGPAAKLLSFTGPVWVNRGRTRRIQMAARRSRMERIGSVVSLVK
jgi:hypothetical protein